MLLVMNKSKNIALMNPVNKITHQHREMKKD